MKGAIGAIIAIAATVGLAKKIKEESEREHEETKLLLEMEAKERQQRLELEATKLRIKKEQMNKRYEDIISNPPQIPVFRKVDATCPCCSGVRDMDLNKGIIVCPYCDFFDKLPIDYYKTDQEKLSQMVDEIGFGTSAKNKVINDNKAKNWLKAAAIAYGILTVLLLIMLLFNKDISVVMSNMSLLFSIIFSVIFPKESLFVNKKTGKETSKVVVGIALCLGYLVIFDLFQIMFSSI